MLALFSAPSSFFTISQAAADDAGAEPQRTASFSIELDTLDGLAINTNQFGRTFQDRNGEKFTLEKFNGDTLEKFNGDTLENFNGDTLTGLAINTNQFGRIFEDRNGEKFTLEKFNGDTLDFNGDTLTGFNGDTLSFNGDTLEKFNGDTIVFNGDTLEKFNGDTLSFNGDTLEKFNGDTLRFNGLISFNGDTLSFNGDAMSFNGDTLERFNADDLMKDFKDFNGDLVKFNGGFPPRSTAISCSTTAARVQRRYARVHRRPPRVEGQGTPPPPAGRVHRRHRPVGRGRARGVNSARGCCTMDMARVCACITYRSERGLYWSRPTGYASLRLTASVPCAQSQSQNISPKFLPAPLFEYWWWWSWCLMRARPGRKRRVTTSTTTRGPSVADVLRDPNRDVRAEGEPVRPHRGGEDQRQPALQRGVGGVDEDRRRRRRRGDAVVERVAVLPEVRHHVLDAVAPVQPVVADELEQHEVRGEARHARRPRRGARDRRHQERRDERVADRWRPGHDPRGRAQLRRHRYFPANLLDRGPPPAAPRDEPLAHCGI